MAATSKPRVHKPARLGFSIPAAAAELDVPESTMRKAVQRGEIQSVNFGGSVRIPPAEIARLRRTFAAAN
jgi:excisionase family DNA binding protein